MILKFYSPFIAATLLSLGAAAQFSCGTAVTISNGYTSGIISTPGTSGSQDWVGTATATCGTASNSAFTSSDVYLFKYTTGAVAGEAFYFSIECDYVTDDEHAIGVWTGCSGSTLSGCVTSTYEFANVEGVCAQNLAANTTYYIGVGKQYGTKALKFKVLDFTVESSTTIPGNTCPLAASISIADPYSGSTRCNYTAWSGSPSACGMSIENDSWMKFVAAASTVVIEYKVSNCTDNYGVQLSVFRGSCGALTLLTGSCVNYAANNSTGTWTFTGLTVGNTYYIRTDGYAGDLCSYSFNPISGVAILPITLVNFQAISLENGYNKLTWKTASEVNSSYIEIEKSSDGIHFNSVKQVAAAGNSSQTINYYELDKADDELYAYYRLKLVDLNGSFSYSEVQAVLQNQAEAVSVFPNPAANGEVELAFNSFDTYNEVVIQDLQGRTVFMQSIGKEAKVKLDVSAVPAGVYQVLLSGRQANVTRKLIIE